MLSHQLGREALDDVSLSRKQMALPVITQENAMYVNPAHRPSLECCVKSVLSNYLDLSYL